MKENTEIADGPSGSVGPTDVGDGSMEVLNAESQVVFPCRKEGCNRAFPTVRGRGVHEQRQHKDWNDERLASSIVNVKAPWSSEEAALLARQEAQLCMAGVKFANQALKPYFPSRTLEAIKGQRRKACHKQRVQDLIMEFQQAAPPNSTPAASDEKHSEEVGDSLVAEIKDELSRCPPINGTDFCARHLNRICLHANKWDSDTLFEEISAYLREVFPAPKSGRKKGDDKQPQLLSKRKQRRADYARTQRAWKKNPCKYLRALLKDKGSSTTPEEQVMTPYWQAVMTDGSKSSPGVGGKRPTIEAIWRAIKPEEVLKAIPEMTTSPGPDMVTARQLRAMPPGILARILNVFLICGKLPTWLLESRTTLIPKKDNAVEPGDFRPITVSSVITRTFHKVLANRLRKNVELDCRQKAFIPIDGSAENTFLLDMVLRYHRQTFKPLYLASVDLTKAFDSVSHETIIDTLTTMGAPGPMVAYVAHVYKNSQTTLACDGWNSHKIHPTCGVKQGDPLSPMLFNMVIDRMFQHIPKEVGVDVAGTKYNVLAFADDLILMATTPQGLQLTIDKCTGFLSQCGLVVNTNKSFTTAIRNVPHVKKSVVDPNVKFECMGRVIPAMRRQDEWKYLGIPFTPEGRTTTVPEAQLREAIVKLTKAPLKPQQRLFALRVVVLPSLYHALTLGSTDLSRLNKVDTLVRGAVRKWLALPHDVPNAYIHAKAADGGLSIPSMRWLMPLHRKERLEAMSKKDKEPGSFLTQEIQKSKRRLKDANQDLRNVVEIERRWARILHNSIDGKALQDSSKVPHQNRWITDGTRFLTGKDYVNCAKLRINALPTKSRSSRGRQHDRLCRAGCNAVETLNHIVQKCHRTHGARIARHNAIVSYIHRALQKKFGRVEEEPLLETPDGTRKPDLVAASGTTVLVVDAQVVSEQTDLRLAHERKKSYYRDSAHAALSSRFPSANIQYTSATISWRGVWSVESADELVKLGVLKRNEMKVLATRALVGGLNCYGTFNKTTDVRRRLKIGVG